MNMVKIFRQATCFMIAIYFFASTAVADTEANNEPPYRGPSVEDHIALMDTDKNGFADVHEVRAFLESKHGKEYERDIFDRWESSSTSKSCGSSFSKSLY